MTLEEFQLIVGMMLVTVLVRYPVLAIVGRVTLPERAIHALRFVPVAVLSAIIAPELLIRDGSLCVVFEQRLPRGRIHFAAGCLALGQPPGGDFGGNGGLLFLARCREHDLNRVL